MTNCSSIIVPIWEYQSPPSFLPYFFWEKWDFYRWRVWLMLNWRLPLIICAIYLVTIFSLRYYMSGRRAFKLQGPLVAWNLALGLFSFLGMMRIGPELWGILESKNGFHKSACIRDGLNAPTALWGVLFVLSKVVELGDTLFVVLRKKPLIFLHWYHHCSALLLAWQVFPYAEPIGRYYALMNYTVHSIMYPYYAAKALKIFIPRKFSMIITLTQLVQMIVGVGVNFYTLACLYIFELPCAREMASVKYVGLVYGSFTYLFADFMYANYFSVKIKKC